MNQTGPNLEHFRTLRLRVKDKHAAELARQARAVNFVRNYFNELSDGSERGYFLSPFLTKYLVEI